MIDEKFSASAFSAAGFGTKQARNLSRELQDEIVLALSESLAIEMRSVVARLNMLGHRLEPFGPQPAGEVHFRELDPDGKLRYQFLVAADLTISVGYPQTTDA